MTDLFSLADIDTPLSGSDAEPERLEFELRYRDGTSTGGYIVSTRDEFEDELDSIFDEEIDLRLAQPRSPECQRLAGFHRPAWRCEIEDDWKEIEEAREQSDDLCGCRLGPCFCYSSLHYMLDTQRERAMWALAGCTEPAIIATWHWHRNGTSGTDTIYTIGLNRQSFVNLRDWLPSANEEDS